jgi:hypothetical protein
MTLLKFVASAFVALVGVVSLHQAPSNAASAAMVNNPKNVKVESVPIKVGPIVPAVKAPIKVIPLITPENDPRNKPEVYSSYEEYETSETMQCADPNVNCNIYGEDYDTDSGYEGEVDSDGGHYGYHYDSDDTSEYNKDKDGHYGYHYDDDVQPGKGPQEHGGSHYRKYHRHNK